MSSSSQPVSSASTRIDAASSIQNSPAPAPEPEANQGPPADAAPADPSGALDSDDDGEVDDSPDPLYDPRADAADAAWVRRHLSAAGVAGGGETDVRLTCPSCFALLCACAQPHVEYEGQFRAVFVSGVEVSQVDTVRVKVSGREPAQERYRPVSCVRCRTEVAVLDEDDVYHFCNVLY